MKLPIIGIIASVLLALIGVLCKIDICLIAGVVLMMCNIGLVFGIRSKNKSQKQQ